MLSKYAKMIIALDNPLLNDWCYTQGDNVVIQVNETDWFTAIYGLARFGDCNDELVRMKPLPTLMQLQKYSCIPYWDLFLFDIVNKYSDYDTAEEAAFACIMYEKYQKKWDGEKWVHFSTRDNCNTPTELNTL
jgi:hypothetical protein